MAFPGLGVISSAAFREKFEIQIRSTVESADDPYGVQETWITWNTYWCCRVPFDPRTRLEYSRRGIHCDSKLIFRGGFAGQLDLGETRFVDNQGNIFVPAQPSWEPDGQSAQHTAILVRAQVEEYQTEEGS